MNLKLFEVSIVIVGNDCNPTILNPDFLTKQNIVREEWGWQLAGAPITTPPFATAAYDSGVAITVDTSKVQVVAAWHDDDTWDRIAHIARRYVEVLPHVRYTGVGNNFRGVSERDEAEAFLKNRLLKPGAWDSEAHSIAATAIKFIYPRPDARLSLTIDGGAITQHTNDQYQEIRGVLLHANFHRDCKTYPSFGEVAQHIARGAQDKKDFFSIASKAIGTA